MTEITYQTEIQEDFLHLLDMLAIAADDLSLQHPLEHSWNEALALHLVFYSWVVAETGLDKVLKEHQKELLGIVLVSNLKIVRDLKDEYDNSLRNNRLTAVSLLLKDGILDEVLHYTERAKVLLVFQS